MEKMQKKLDNNFISYHGCGLYRMDGSNVLITKDFPCSTPIKNIQLIVLEQEAEGQTK